jgi:hypothetical protein
LLAALQDLRIGACHAATWRDWAIPRLVPKLASARIIIAMLLGLGLPHDRDQMERPGTTLRSERRTRRGEQCTADFAAV